MEADGQSFLPVLRGMSHQPREWVYCHYIRNGVKKRPTEAKQAQEVLRKQKVAKQKKLMGRFARNQTYKLYEDGRFYNVSQDVLEKHSLPPKQDTEARAKVRAMLQQVHDSMPAWKAFK